MQPRIERLTFELAAFQIECQRLAARERLLLTNERGQRRPWRDEDRQEREHHEALQAIRVPPERRRTRPLPEGVKRPPGWGGAPASPATRLPHPPHAHTLRGSGLHAQTTPDIT